MFLQKRQTADMDPTDGGHFSERLRPAWMGAETGHVRRLMSAVTVKSSIMVA